LSPIFERITAVWPPLKIVPLSVTSSAVRKVIARGVSAVGSAGGTNVATAVGGIGVDMAAVVAATVGAGVIVVSAGETLAAPQAARSSATTRIRSADSIFTFRLLISSAAARVVARR